MANSLVFSINPSALLRTPSLYISPFLASLQWRSSLDNSEKSSFNQRRNEVAQFQQWRGAKQRGPKMEKAAETSAEMVEKVAEMAKKVAFDIADALPDNSKLKQEVLDVERFAERVEKGAKRAEEFILKADHITDEVDELVAPMIEEREKIEKDKVETIVSSSNVL